MLIKNATYCMFNILRATSGQDARMWLPMTWPLISTVETLPADMQVALS